MPQLIQEKTKQSGFTKKYFNISKLS